MPKKRKKAEQEAYNKAVAEAAAGSAAAAAAVADLLMRDREVPEMPLAPANFEHREIISPGDMPFSSLVARPVDRKEISVTPAAQVALDKEWDKLVQAGCLEPD